MTADLERTRRALELFQAACDLGPDERERFVAAECAGDAALRAEVEALIAEDARESETFGSAAIERGREQLDAMLERREAPLPEAIGGYRVLSLLGEGGMGLVYEAEQASPRRRVALKVVHPAVLTPERLDRLRRESEILGHLEHPGIARIYEAGLDDLGRGSQPFFAMEFVEGVPLTDFAAAQGLDQDARLRLFLRVCDAIRHAHEQGVVHRDLKPDNILVRADGQPAVLDFGVARASDPDLKQTTVGSGESKIVGTLTYMSPEQAGGGSGAVDARADVFALGAILFELLSGVLPHDLRGLPLVAALHLVQTAEPRRLATVAPDLRGDLDTIVAKALDRDPARRYPDARALADDVERFLGSRPIRARPPSRLYLLGKFARRNRALVAGATTAAVALVAGTVVAVLFALQSARSEREARDEAYLARLEAASASLERGDPLRARRSLEATDPERRGWEWRHLWSQVEGTSITLPGSVNPGSPIAVDGAADLVAALDGSRLAWWDASAATPLGALDLGVELTSLAPFAVHGAFLVGTADGRALCVDHRARAVRDTWLLAPSEPVTAVAWSADGSVVVGATRQSVVDGSAGDGTTGGGPRTLMTLGEKRFVGAIDVAPDGSRVVVTDVLVRTGRRDPTGRVELIDRADGASLATASYSGGTMILSPRFAPDGATLAVGGSFGTSALLDGHDLTARARLASHRLPVSSIAWSPDGSAWATFAHGGTLCVRDAERGEPARVLGVGDGPLTVSLEGDGSRADACALMDDGRLLVTRGESLLLWYPTEGSSLTLSGHDSYVYNARFIDEGRTVLSRSLNGPVVFWDVLEGTAVAGVHGYRGGVGRFAVVGDTLRLPSRAGGVTLDIVTLEPWTGPEPEGRPLHPLSAESSISPDGLYEAKGQGRELRLVETGEVLAVLEGDPPAAPGIAFHPSEPIVILTSDLVRGFSVPGGELLFELDGHVGAAYCAAYSPDGERLATGGADGTIVVWDAERLTPLLTLREHDNYVRSVDWSPDGTRLVSGSGDLTVRVWDSVPANRRHAERLAWRELRAAVEPQVRAALEAAPDANAAAAQLRTDPDLTGDRRAATLDILRALCAERRAADPE